MKKILLVSFLLVSLLSAQSFHIKQITNFNADCRNITRSGALFYGYAYYAFEAHTGNSSSIYLGTYLADADSFSIITKVTNDSYMNINPQLISSYDTLYIIYQTNRNGNWDIAYNIYLNNQLSQVNYIANSGSDETNPNVQFHYVNGSYPINLVFYQSAGSVWVKNLSSPQISAITVFKGDSTTSYSQTSFGIYDNNFKPDRYVAAKKISNGKSSIVVKSESSNWGSEDIAADSGDVDSPELQFDVLTYNNDLEGKKNIYILSDITKPLSFQKLITNPNYDYFNFRTDMTPILTNSASYYQFFPYSYQVLRNDSLFIRVNLNDQYPYNQDTLIYTKVKDSKLLMGNMGYYLNYFNYYTFWEDSIDGKIQILGSESLVTIGGVNDKYPPNDFVLEQNYPNPFNPATTINYSIESGGNVKLIIYNLLGQEIHILENSFKKAGRYTVNFNASDLPSGIYFYKLEAGKNAQVKKMVLVK